MCLSYDVNSNTCLVISFNQSTIQSIEIEVYNTLQLLTKQWARSGSGCPAYSDSDVHLPAPLCRFSECRAIHTRHKSQANWSRILAVILRVTFGRLCAAVRFPSPSNEAHQCLQRVPDYRRVNKKFRTNNASASILSCVFIAFLVLCFIDVLLQRNKRYTVYTKYCN